MDTTEQICFPASITVDILPDADEIGETLATYILDKVECSRQLGQRFLLGCPAGGSLQSTYREMGYLAAQRRTDLSGLVIVTMGDYVERTRGEAVNCPHSAHYSWRRFARHDIAGEINALLPEDKQVPPDNIWCPDPATPAQFDTRIEQAGGIDLFLLACGASDGHVGFNCPGSSRNSRTRIARLAESTRLDNLSTFPQFLSMHDVPGRGVTVGLGTIAKLSEEVVLVMHGSHKHNAAVRLSELSDFSSRWPASIIYRCKQARIMLDDAASREEVTMGAVRESGEF